MITVTASSGQPAMLTLEKLPAGQAPTADIPRWQQMLNPDGTWSILKVGTGTPNAGHALALPDGIARWAAILPPEMASQAEGGVQFIGNLKTSPPAVEECTPLRQQSPLLPVPPGVNLARNLDWTPFGVEERVQEENTTTDTPSWKMKPGSSPAGLYAARPWRLPRTGGKEAWSLELIAHGSGSVTVGLAVDNGRGFGDASILGKVDLTAEDRTHSWKLTRPLTEAKQLRMVLLAPNDRTAELSISSAIFSTGTKTADVVKAELGLWNWSTKPGEWQRLQPAWKHAGIQVLQLALPRVMEEGTAGTLAGLSALHDAGYRVVAVEGDPHMILPQEKSAVLARHKQLLAWHGKYLDGIQYDVEPYLLPGFRLEPELWHQHWLEMYEMLTAGKTPIKVEPVMPFWLITQPAAGKLLKGLASRSDRIVIMNYRSDAGDAAAWATAWLEWSMQHQCPVAFAVECGPVPDLQSATFRRAEKGTLWMKPWPGHGTAAVLFDSEVSPGNGALTFGLVRQGTVSGSATSLQGKSHEQVAAWLQTMRDISQRLNMPSKLMPRLLLHEPTEELLQFLGDHAK